MVRLEAATAAYEGAGLSEGDLGPIVFTPHAASVETTDLTTGLTTGRERIDMLQIHAYLTRRTNFQMLGPTDLDTPCRSPLGYLLLPSPSLLGGSNRQ